MVQPPFMHNVFIEDHVKHHIWIPEIAMKLILFFIDYTRSSRNEKTIQ